MREASLVNTRVVKADFGWTFDHLDVLTISITNSLSSNSIKRHKVSAGNSGHLDRSQQW